jgi:peptide/nickel transport system permease protein
MARHIIRRLLQAIPTIFGITILSYFIMSLAPGGPVRLLIPEDPQSSRPEVRQMLTEVYGLNEPWHVQYLAWLVGNDWMWWRDLDRNDDGKPDDQYVSYGILRGDFGKSFKTRDPVMGMIIQRIPATLELGVSALVVSLVIGLPIGILAAVWRGSFFDNFTRIFAVIGNAVPDFWMGLMLIIIFGIVFGAKWAQGNQCDVRMYSRTGCPPVYERMAWLILPTAVLSFGRIAAYSRYMRTSMLDTINSDFVRTARAKGLRPRVVWYRHAARNALIPVATSLGPAIVGILGGAVVIEGIFTWPGLGKLIFDAATGRDFPLVMASVFVGSILTVLGLIISDVAYAIVDPRIRF